MNQFREFLSLSAGRTRTLQTNFVWNAGGNAVFALCQWGILIVFAKLGNATVVGQLVYGLALAAPLFVVAGLQLRSIQATDRENRYPLGKYLGLRVVTTCAALVAAFILAAAMWAAGSQSALIIVLWALAKTADSGSDALYGLFQQFERMDYVGFSLALRGIAAIASVAVLFRVSHSVALTLVGMATAWGAVFILYDIPTARNLLLHRTLSAPARETTAERFSLVFDLRSLMPLCCEAAPLGIVAFLLTIQVQVPRYVVMVLLHTRSLGLFSAAAYLTFVGGVLVTSLGDPAMVRLAQYYSIGRRSAFRQLMVNLLLVAAAVGIAGIAVSLLAGGRVLTLLYTKEYSGMGGVLTMLCVGCAISFFASFLGYGMTAQRRFKIQVPIFILVVLTTVTSCYLLTKRYGLMGTAAGIVVGNLVQLVMSAVVVWRTAQQKATTAGVCETLETAESVL